MWIYKLDKSYTYTSPLLNGTSFENEWGNIRDGVLTIYKGYAWDGCTPKFKITKTTVVGVWDGRKEVDGKPTCYYASLVHDYFCQFKNDVPVTRVTTISIFKQMLKERGFVLQPFYVAAITLFGPKKFKGDTE